MDNMLDWPEFERIHIFFVNKLISHMLSLNDAI